MDVLQKLRLWGNTASIAAVLTVLFIILFFDEHTAKMIFVGFFVIVALIFIIAIIVNRKELIEEMRKEWQKPWW